jgi:predicted NACHT family NTPase
MLEISKLIENTIGKLLSTLETHVSSEIRFICSNKILEYQLSLLERNLTTKTLFHRNAIELDKIFVPQKLRLEGSLDFIEATELQKLLNSKKKLVLLGDAGIGKSTLIKFLILNSIKFNHSIPIQIELREFEDEHEIDLFKHLINNVLKFEGITDNENIATRLLEKGNFIFYFDGFDEVSKKIKSKLTSSLSKFVNKFNNCHYVITSRLFTGIEYLPHFQNVYVQPLDKDQIKEFIDRQCKESNPELALKILNSLEMKEVESYISYLENPLLLILFILTFEENTGLPKLKSEFYRDVFETLLNRHNSYSKRGFERKLECGLEKSELETTLKRFSFLSFFEEKFLFTESYLLDKLEEIKARKTQGFDTASFKDDMVISIAIISKEGRNFFFPHKTLQEYFAASYFLLLTQENKIKAYKKLVKKFSAKDKLSDLSSFFSLLLEIDKHNSISLFLLPVLRNLLKELPSSTTSYDKQFKNFYRNIEIFKFFNFDDFYSVELLQKGSNYHERISKINKYDSRIEEQNNLIKHKHKENKELRKELKWLQKIDPLENEVQDYENNVFRIKRETEYNEKMILSADSSKDEIEVERSEEIIGLSELVIDFNAEVLEYLKVKIPELENEIKVDEDADGDLIDLI